MDKERTQSGENGSPTVEFTPPRHWVAMEELSADYWNDSVAQEKRGQEFLHKPIETLEMLEKLDSKGIGRRGFMTIMGASMAMAGFACARRPVHKIIPYVVKPEEITPGVSTYYASTWEDLGILVETREGRPIKLEGNPDHPLSRGHLSARGQASLLNLYDPDRLRQPVKLARGQGAGSAKAVTWKELDAEVVGRLRRARNVRILSRPVTGEATRRLISEFLSGFGDGRHVEWEPLSHDLLTQGQKESYGTEVIPTYFFDRADTVVSFGADFLGTWNLPVEQANDWVKTRIPSEKAPGSASMSKLVVFESTPTLTGNNADEKYLVKAGDELKVALAIAHEIIVRRGRSQFAGNGDVTNALKAYSVDEVAKAMGGHVRAEDLRRIAERLWNDRGRSILVAGGPQVSTENGLALQVVVNLLNSALENEGRTVDGTGSPRRIFGSMMALQNLLNEMKRGEVDVLIVWGANPEYSLPASAGWANAASKVKSIVAVSDRIDETASGADYVAADDHYLETWGDAHPRGGIYSIQQPALAPIHDTRAFQASLLLWAKGAGKASALMRRSEDWHQYLMGVWQESIYPRAGRGQSFQQFWENTLQKGVLVLGERAAGGARGFRTSAMSLVRPAADTKADFVVALYEKVSMGDGEYANNAWLQELPDPVSSATWDNYINISPVAAEKLGVKTNDVLEVTVGETIVALPANVLPGTHPETLGIAVGYGRKSVGRVGNEVGANAYELAQYRNGRTIYSGVPAKVRKTGRRYEIAITQGHFRTLNRPIINDISLEQFRKDPKAESHTDPHIRVPNIEKLTLWESFEYKGYRWGMAIDLNACIGCSACMIACQAENNVPVVGRDRVRYSREMHWIRIDRYFSGSPVNPQVVYQPMLCQHCENASCETVCPVLATVHNDEGLSEQVYNRCVGTRYCQNNCPYKVRRFNFFDHWKDYRDPMNMVWNPDVTVRSRGIMEKCSFCIQRIQDAKDTAKDDGRKVRDGELQTACQQTCPTNAIVFGNINDPEAVVTQMQKAPRAYRVLEIVGNKPVITYQTKVRNAQTVAAAHQEGAADGHH